jgi:hypothetical protein
MLDIKEDITSLSNFQRNTRDFLQRLQETRRPLILTVNGKAELIVQDAASYQKVLNRLGGIGSAQPRPTKHSGGKAE